MEKNMCAAQWGLRRGLSSLAGRAARGEERMTHAELCLHWKWVLLVLKEVLFPSLSKKERELAPRWTEAARRGIACTVTALKGGPAVAHVFLWSVPCSGEKALMETTMLLIHYVRASCALHFPSLFSMITLWLYLILSRVSFPAPFSFPYSLLTTPTSRSLRPSCISHKCVSPCPPHIPPALCPQLHLSPWRWRWVGLPFLWAWEHKGRCSFLSFSSFPNVTSTPSLSSELDMGNGVWKIHTVFCLTTDKKVSWPGSSIG